MASHPASRKAASGQSPCIYGPLTLAAAHGFQARYDLA